MRLALAKLLSLALVAAALAAVAPAPARAGVAERCNWRGCAYIHCNWTGDRCYRIDEYGVYRGYYGEGYRDHAGEYYGDDRRYRRRYADREYRAAYRNGWRTYRPYHGWKYDED